MTMAKNNLLKASDDAFFWGETPRMAIGKQWSISETASPTEILMLPERVER